MSVVVYSCVILTGAVDYALCAEGDEGFCGQRYSSLQRSKCSKCIARQTLILQQRKHTIVATNHIIDTNTGYMNKEAYKTVDLQAECVGQQNSVYFSVEWHCFYVNSVAGLQCLTSYLLRY